MVSARVIWKRIGLLLVQLFIRKAEKSFVNMWVAKALFTENSKEKMFMRINVIYLEKLRVNLHMYV